MQKKNKYFSIFLCLVIAIASLLLFTINEKDKLEAASGNWSSYTTIISKGKGTYYDPYLIESAGNLAYMINNHKNAYCKQVADIDLSAHYWEPIGNSSNNFLGNYDGNGFIIKNITFSGYTYNCAGLFGYTYMSTLENITLHSGTIKGITYVGGIVGYANSGRINNCINKCDVGAQSRSLSGSWLYSGGIAGRTAGPITNCKNYGDVSIITANITNYCAGGGIVGYRSSYSNDSQTTISACINYGNINVNDYQSYSGGIVGITSSDANNLIELCINFGEIVSTGTGSSSYPYSYSGGIIGKAGSNDATIIDQCMNKGYVESNVTKKGSPTSFAGGISGRYGTITNCLVLDCTIKSITVSTESTIDKETNIVPLEYVGTDWDYSYVEFRYTWSKRNNYYSIPCAYGYESSVTNCLQSCSTSSSDSVNGQSLKYGQSLKVCTAIDERHAGLKILLWTCAWSNALKNDHFSFSENALMLASEIEGSFDSKQSTTNCKSFTSISSIPSGFSTSVWGINNSAINNGGMYLKNLYW